MATITQVTMGREGHYRFTRLNPDTSAMDAAECECGATWIKAEMPQWDSFCHWALDHQQPTLRRAFVTDACRGSFGLIKENLTDGNHVGWCHICQRYRPTSPQEGYDGWRQFDAHPLFVAVKP